MRRLRVWFAATLPGGPGSPSAPLRGLPLAGLDEGRMNGGESLRDHGGLRPPVRPRKHGPEVRNRRGGAPEGVPLSGLESAPAEARKGGGGETEKVAPAGAPPPSDRGG